MKKLLSIIVLGLLLSGNAYAQQISCKGVNTPNARFIINDDSIILSASSGSMTFEKSWGMSKNVHKGKLKTKAGGNKKIWEVQIDTRRGEAQIITTTYYSTTSDDVYVRNYRNCRWKNF